MAATDQRTLGSRTDYLLLGRRRCQAAATAGPIHLHEGGDARSIGRAGRGDSFGLR